MYTFRRPSPRTQQVKHFLLQWYKLDSNINDLDEVETIKAKTLYTALKQMDPEEVKFLANKYRHPRIKTDAVLREEYGMSQEEYRKKRFDIEYKMLPFIKKAIEHYREELSEAVRLEYGRTRERRELKRKKEAIKSHKDLLKK